MWEIDNYCYEVAPSDKPVKEAPTHSLAWKAHLNSIVSVDLAEDKGLIITASTDCCVRMFTLNGRYIGVCKQIVSCDVCGQIKMIAIKLMIKTIVTMQQLELNSLPIHFVDQSKCQHYS